MSQRRDLYEVLGVGKDASAADLKKAYRKLAMQHHPDRNPGDADAATKFKEAAEAYKILSDDAQRQRYDRMGFAGLGGSSQQFGGADEIFAAFGDVFADLFGFGGAGGRQRQRGARRGPRPGNDLRYDLLLEFKEAVFGLKREIVVPRQEDCGTCSGRGGKAGTQPVRCTTCNGRGEVIQQQAFLQVRTTCPHCRGEGEKFADPCPDCSGRGRVMREKKLDVTVPRGVDDGMQLRLGGEGEPGAMGGPPGDLYVFIRVKSHDVFERHGNDIACAADIPFPVAALGGQIEVPTLEGTASLDVPQGAQHGDLLRLAGLGVPDVRSGQRGDQLVQVRLRVPKSLNDRQRELLRELGEIEGAKIKAAGESSMKRFFSKLVGDD